jgi:hypothetical protein
MSTSSLDLQQTLNGIEPKSLHARLRNLKDEHYNWIPQFKGGGKVSRTIINSLYDVTLSAAELCHPSDFKFVNTKGRLAKRFHYHSILRLGTQLADHLAGNTDIVETETDIAILNYDAEQNTYGRTLVGVCVNLAKLKSGPGSRGSIVAQHFKANTNSAIMFRTPYGSQGTLIIKGKAVALDPDSVDLLKW